MKLTVLIVLLLIGSFDGFPTRYSHNSHFSHLHLTRSSPVSTHRLSMSLAGLIVLLLIDLLHGAPNSWPQSSAFAVDTFLDCSLAPDVGHCRGYFKRYYYDARTGRCMEFIYGGCGGNANNFQTKGACKKACQ